MAGAINAMHASDRERFRQRFEPYLSLAESPGVPSPDALADLEHRHNVNRFLPLIDAAGAPPALVKALGLEEVPIPKGQLRPAELGDYEVVRMSGAGERVRVVGVELSGYRVVKSGRVLRKPKVEVRAE
jgi:hypothetical protein